MGITSLQVCVDSSSDWLKGTIWEEGTGMASSPITTPPGEDNILACTRPLIERRLRPQHEQALKCPRCESTHTKFCYYNNYSLSQPRYFCKTCRRYWTKGGTLRNIPVGGGCRKNKKVSSANSKKPSSASSTPDCHTPPSSSLIQLNQQHNVHAGISPPLLSYSTHSNPTDLQLAFPEQLHFSAMFNNAGTNHGFLLENPTPIDFMENKYEALVGSHDFMGSGESFGGINNNGEMMSAHNAANFHDFCLSYGPSSLDHGNSSAAAGAAILESCQRLMLPYDQHHHHQQLDRGSHEIDVKPNAKILSLEWHDHQQVCNSDAGYNFGGLGSWTGLMNGYGSSATNPLV